MPIPVQPSTMVAICQKFPCAPEVTALAAEYPVPAEFIAKLRQAQKQADAVQALARFLPKDKAVAWAAQGARMAGAQTGISSAELQALDAAESWAAQPIAANGDIAAQTAPGLPVHSPAYWTAQAAAFGNGVEVPADQSSLAGSEDLTAHFAAGAVSLAAA